MTGKLLVALSAIIAASAARQAPTDGNDGRPAGAPRPLLSPGRASTGAASRASSAEPRQWAEADVDVDKEWAKEGVKVIG